MTDYYLYRLEQPSVDNRFQIQCKIKVKVKVKLKVGSLSPLKLHLLLTVW